MCTGVRPLEPAQVVRNKRAYPTDALQDAVTPPGDTRQALAAAAIALAVLTLLPMVPGATDVATSPPPGLFL